MQQNLTGNQWSLLGIGDALVYLLHFMTIPASIFCINLQIVHVKTGQTSVDLLIVFVFLIPPNLAYIKSL